MRSRFAADRGLVARMLVTMFLLGLVYVAFAAFFVAYVDAPVVAVILVAAGAFAVQWFLSDRIALFAMHGREVGPEEAPILHGVVDRLCALADMPKPRVAIVDSDLPNAFATGRSARRAVVCVSTGLLRRLEPPELEAVLAHELSHVAHRDVAVMTVASFLGVLAGIITRFGLRMGLSGGRRDQRSTAVFLAVLLMSSAVYAVSFLLIRALSRYRELAADRAGALLTGAPATLMSALTKVSGEMSRVPTRDLREVEPFNAFFFAPAIAPGVSLSSIFATHPPLERRLDALARLAADLGHGR